MIATLLVAPGLVARAGEPEGGATELTSAGILIDVAAEMSTVPPVGQSIEASPGRLSDEAVEVSASVFSASPGIASTLGRYAWNDILNDCAIRPCTQPPNAGIAVGSSAIVEWTDQGLSFRELDGRFIGTISHEAFFDEHPFQHDAWSLTVVWDSLHGRWLASEATEGEGVGRLYLAVSASADATGSWKVYTWDRSGAAAKAQRITIGATSDKIIIGAEYTKLGCPVGCGAEPSLRIADTAAAYALPVSLPTWVSSVEGTNDGSLRPVMSLTPTTTGFVVSLREANPNFTSNIGYLAITGTVAGGNIVVAHDLDLTAYGLAAQPAPNGTVARTDGAATAGGPTSAVWASDRLWFALTIGCLTTCVRAIELSTATPGNPTVVQQLDIDDASGSAFAPGVALAGNGSLWLAFARARPEGVIEPFVAYRASGDAAGTIRTPARLLPGTGVYGGNLWGPGAGIARDPANPASVWQHTAASAAAGGWISIVSKLTGGQSSGPGGTVVIEDGAPKTFYLRVDLSVTRGAGRAVTEVRISNDPTMTEFREAASLPTGSWQLDDLVAGGSKATGTRVVWVQFGDGAGNWSSPVSDTITVDGSVPLSRFSGTDRYATAAAISKATFSPGVPYVFIASGLNFPDALAGASAAGWNGSPILFVGSTLPAATITELQRLKPETIVVLGGPSVVSTAIASSLVGYATSHDVVRLSGPDRFATAAAISAWAFPDGAPFAFIAYGHNFPDALAAGPIAGLYGAPILFVNTSSIPSATTAELLRLQPAFVVIVGSQRVVGTAVESQLVGLLGVENVGRLAGPDRYGTAAAIVDWVFLPSLDGAFIASGLNFPDALAGAAAAATTGNPILFVGKTVPTPTAFELDYLAPKQYWILGGTSVVSSTVANQLLPYLGP